ncbi:MAG: DUF11 domain-containing protein, partial [Actinomycetota bacterium]|nr:DUF11 domain-containing protein [Actinomycetota bacterium]
MTLHTTLRVAGSVTIFATKTASRATDPAAANDSASATLNAERSADVGVSLTFSEQFPLVGNVATMRVAASNAGPDTVNDVVVTTGLPAGLTVLSTTASGGVFDVTSGRWSIGTMAATGSAQLEVHVRIDGAGELPFSAGVTRSDLPDDNPLNNYTTATLNPVVSTGLYVTKVASRRHLAVLDLVGFFVMVTNDGPATVQNVVVSDPLPNGLAFVSAHTRAGGYDPSSGLWAVGAIAPGERRALTIVARVDREGSITNTARLIGGLGADLLLEDNASSVTVSADPAADIEISVEGLDKISVNGTGPYVVRARNLGPSHATGVTVTAGIPLGLSFRNALASAGAYSAGTGEWMIGALRAGEAATLIVTAQVLNENVVVRAAKTKGDQFDPVIGNNQTAAVPAGAVWADVQIDMRVDALAPHVGEPLIATVVARNAGPRPATNVVAHVMLPAGLTVDSIAASSGAYDAATGLWTIGTLPVDAEINLQLRGVIGTSGPLVFVAQKTSSSPVDPVTANDQSGAAVNAQLADLQVVTTVDLTEPLEGERVTLTTIVSNNSRTAASGVAVRAPLPSGMRYVRHSTVSGTYDVSTGIWSIGAIPEAGPGGNVTLQVVAVVATRAALNPGAALDALDQVDLVSTNNASSQAVAASTWSTFQTDLALETQVTPAVASAGGTVAYVVTSTNRGPTYTTEMTISGEVPEHTTFVSLTPSAGANCVVPGVGMRGQITCEWPDVTRLEARSFTLIVRVDDAAREGATVRSRFATDAPIGEYFPANNVTINALSIVRTTSVDLEVSAIVRSASGVAAGVTLPVGSTANVQFMIRNGSVTPLAGARFLIRGLDASQFVIETVSTSHGQGSGTATEAEWMIGALAPGETSVLDVRVRVTGMRAASLEILRLE